MWRTTEKNIKELFSVNPDLSGKPADFDDFWETKKQKVLAYEPSVKVKWIKFPVPAVEVGEIELISWDGTPLKGFIIKPKGVTKSSILCSFHGLTGHKGFPTDFLKWTTLGLTVVSFDVRGQGGSADYGKYINGSRVQGWILKGILEPNEYYYTNIYQDIMVQLNWIQNQSIVEPDRIGVIGSSQGGALSIAVTALMKEVVDFTLADCPFMTYVETAIDKAAGGSYAIIQEYFKLNDPQFEQAETIFRTLSYVDTIYFAEKITSPVIMSIGLMDTTTPAISAFSFYNALSSTDKQLDVYPRFEHEIVPFHEIKKFEFIKRQCNI